VLADLGYNTEAIDALLAAGVIEQHSGERPGGGHP